MALSNSRVGSGTIASVDLTQKSALAIAYVDSEWTISTEKLVLGGVPITLYERNNIYAVGVFLTNEAVISDEIFVLSGERFETSTLNDKYIISTVPVEYDDTSENTTIWRGMPIALNSDNALLVKAEDLSSYDEEINVGLGGLPLIARRIGLDWYLGISENTTVSESTTRYLDYSAPDGGTGSFASPFNNNSVCNDAMANGECTTLIVKQTPVIPDGFKADTYLIAPDISDITIESESSTELADILTFHDLTGVTWTNYSGNIYYCEVGITDQKNCIVFKKGDSWETDGYGSFIMLEPFYGANIGAVAGDLTLNRSWVDNSTAEGATGKLYVNVGGDPSSAGLVRSINFGNLNGWNYAGGLITTTGERLTLRRLRVGGSGLRNAANGNVTSMGQWALGGALGDGSRIEECEAWHGSNHCAGWTGVAENATVWVDIRAEQMLPAGVSGTCVFTPTYDGATVNLKIRCDKAVANYGVNTGTSIYAGGGSALLMHDTGGTWAQFNVYDSDLNQQSFQINDDNGPVTITNSALDGYFGTVAPITSGITFDGCTLPFGIPLLLNTTDVVTLNNCTINHLYTRAFNGTIIIDNCDFSIENSGVGHTGNLHIVTNGLANTAFKLTFTDNRITSHASNYYNLFASLRKDNIIEWDRNRWLGPRNCGAILSFDTDNNGVGDGVFYACEGGLNYATSQLSQGLDLNTPTDEASTAGLIAATIQPSTLVARLDMNEPSGGLGYLIRNKAAANYLFIASGSSSTRWEAGPAADSPSISMNGAGRFNRTDGAYILNPVGGAWDFTIAFWLKATAGVNDGMWLISQYNASRTGDRLGIAGGWSGTGTPRDKMIFYVNDGVERIGATNASNYVITYATGAWMHIAIVVKTTALNKSTPYYYVNGVASGNALEFDHPTSYGTWTDFSFGNFNTSLGGYKGSIAGPLCIWNSELTAGEIETLAGV